MNEAYKQSKRLEKRSQRRLLRVKTRVQPTLPVGSEEKPVPNIIAAIAAGTASIRKSAMRLGLLARLFRSWIAFRLSRSPRQGAIARGLLALS